MLVYLVRGSQILDPENSKHKGAQIHLTRSQSSQLTISNYARIKLRSQSSYVPVSTPLILIDTHDEGNVLLMCS